jgi:hypothetical protein
LKERLLAQQFLQKHAENHDLYIFQNLYELNDKKTLILLNLPQDLTSFNNFITNKYPPAQSNQHGIINFNDFKAYFTNILQSITQIIDQVTTVFIHSGCFVVKLQLRFGFIWERPTVEVDNFELISCYT